MGLFPKKDYIRIDIPDDIVEEFRTLARDTGDSVNRLIAMALREWLDEQERRSRGSHPDQRDW